MNYQLDMMHTAADATARTLLFSAVSGCGVIIYLWAALSVAPRFRMLVWTPILFAALTIAGAVWISDLAAIAAP